MNLRSSIKRYSVDAGHIGVIDAKDIPFTHLINIFNVENPGQYKVTIKAKKTWRGAVSKTGILTTTTGLFAVGDLCYMFGPDDWDKIIEETDYLENPKGRFLIVETGGDGSFEARVEFKEIK